MSAIAIRLDQTQLTVGEQLSGTVSWNPPDRHQPVKSASLELRWRTEGRGTRDSSVVYKEVLDLDRLASSSFRPIPFSVRIPEEGPTTYNGSLIRILWELTISIKVPGLFKRAQKESCLLQVTPRQAQWV